jgi:plastocyanin
LVFASFAQGQNCTAAFTWDETDLTIQFTDLSTSDGGPIVSWFWDFDDGSTSTEQNPLHTFPEPDKYDVVLTIETADGCQSEIEIRIETCLFTVNTALGDCDADGFIPLDITINDIYDNADEIDVSLDGVLLPGSPFDIDQANPVTVSTEVSGDGLEHTLTINSLDIPTCSYNESFTVEDCSSDCFLSALSATISTGASHTVNVGGNFFDPVQTTMEVGDVVVFQWIDDGHSTTSDATSGPDSWNSGVISGPSYEVSITNPGLHPYYCIPHGGPGGSGMSGTLIADCPASGEFNVEVAFNASIADPQGFRIYVDGTEVAGSPFSYSGTGPQSQVINIIGDGVVHTIEVEDVADPTCLISTDFQAPDCGAAPSCSITASGEIVSTCDVNNNVDVLITVTHIQPEGDNFEVYVNGILESTTPYDPSGETQVTVSVPGNGSANTLTIQDEVNADCQDEFSITTPDCTQPCEITNVEATAAGGGGGPSGIVHTVFVEDFVFNPVDISISEGDVVRWEWTGQVAHTSTSDATTGADSWASGLLNTGDTYDSPVLSEGVHPYYCEPHGAPGGVGMAGTIEVLPPCNADGEVQVQVSFDIVSPGANGYEVLVDGSVVGSFDYGITNPQVSSVWVVGDGGVHDIEVRDIDDNACLGSTTVTTPSCGGSCSVSASAQVVGSCQANNTVDVEVEVTGNNVGASFELNIDGVLEGSYTYTGGTTVVTVSVAGDGQSHDIEVIDGDDPACTDLVSLTTPDCTQPCEITNLAVSFGMSTRHRVEVLDFEFAPSDLTISLGDTVLFDWVGQIPHTATSDNPAGTNSFQSGLLSQGATFEIIPGAAGNLPYYCEPHGAPGGIGMAGTIDVLGNCYNGQASGTLTFDQSGGGSGFNVYIDDSLLTSSPQPYTQGPVQSYSFVIPGDGLEHTFRLEDSGQTACSVETVETVPDCGMVDPCALSAGNLDVGACEDGSFILQATFSHNGQSDFFQIFWDGLLVQDSLPYSSGTETTAEIELSGTGAEKPLQIRDIADPQCFAEWIVSTPDCGEPCLITTISEDTGFYPTIEVRDFDFFPDSIEVFVGDTIAFIWTGEVAHTSTSDKVSGPNSWDSGLLNQGDTFLIAISETGLHPYYCIPHGGPGGIGMAGTISAIDTCDGEFWRTNISFDVTQGSPLGYNYFVDGVQQNSAPMPYQDRMGTNELLIALPGDGNQHTVTVQDLETSFCAASIFISSGTCGAGCAVTDLEVNAGSQIRHQVEVRDFDYVPTLLEMRSGQNIDFNFTGSIPHTVTSDAISGPDSWDSGLLGIGDTFSLEINNAGSHPYYCIPHGGPGGIGMAGSIEASPLCTNGKVPVRLFFEVNNGSLQGYNLFVDGERIGTIPTPYDDRNGMNTIDIELSGDGEEHIFTIQDVVNPICAASAFAVLENCQQDSCSLEGLEVRLASALSSTVLVRDFDFNPLEITILQGDTVRFFWEGEIPHTATSDDPNHPEAFNSGLLPQGSVFKVALDSAGSHPYYCIPHGGPGGIGMAGTIEVEELCYNDSVFMQASFFGSTYPGQYEVLLDGTPLPNSPFNYDASGEHNFLFSISGEGQDHQLQITDADDNSCSEIVNFEGPDCSDPCIRLVPNFSTTVNSKTATFTNTSQNASRFQWDFGDGSTSSEGNPSHEFSEDGTYTVCLKVEDNQGCEKEYCDKVTIGGERCAAAFEWENQGLSVNLRNTSQTSDSTVTLKWKISDGAQYVNQDNPSHTFSELGVYDICLVISGSTCVDSICQTLDLSNPCILLQVDFSFSPSQADPLSIDFTETIQGSVTNRLWGFGDGTTSTATNPSHTYQSSGVYTVCLLTQDNANQCSKSICKEIQVGTVSNENPVRHSSNFEVYPNPLSTGQPHLVGRGFEEIDHFKEAAYSIWDVQGREVQSGLTRIDTHMTISPRLSPGFYLIAVEGEEQVYLSKFIVTD